MPYRARLPVEFDLADLTHGERELARWAALPVIRRLLIIFYLLRRFSRLARDEARRVCHVAAWEAGVHARALGRDAVAIWRSLRDVRLGDWRDAFEKLVGRPARWALPALYLVTLVALTSVFAGRADEDRKTVRELAIEARAFAPPPCSLTDGEVWVRDGGRYWRPRDRGYAELRQALCGF